MEEIVPVILGEWVCGENGMWKFIARNGQLARCVGIGKDTSYIEMENAVSNVFSINRKRSGLAVTFSYPGESYVFVEGKMPPVAISSDIEFQLYKVKLAQHGGLNLYVTVNKLGDEEAFDVDTNSENSQLNSQFMARVDEIEALYEARQRERAENVNCRSIEKWKQSRQSCGQKRIGGDVTAKGTTLVDDHVVDTLNSGVYNSVDNNSNIGGSRRVDNICRGGVENEDNISSGVYKGVDNCTTGGNISVDNIYSIGETPVDNINLRGDNSLDKAGRGEKCVDISDSAEMDLSSNDSGSEEEDYNFDEWSERINHEYPPDWDPYVLGGRRSYGHMALLADLENGISKDGEAWGERISEEHEMTPIGFSLGIEEDGIPSTSVVPVDGNPSIRSADEEAVLASVEGLIDREDPLLLHDDPPFNDSQEKNVVAIKGDVGLYVGRIFENKKQLRNVLSKYAMQEVFAFKVLKSDKRRVIAQCIDNKCGWRVYATYHANSANVEIKTLNLEHNCDVSARGRYGEKATSTILGELLEAKYANGKKGPRVCDLPEMVLAEHNVTISYRKAWKAKELAISASRGNEEDSFKYLSTYLHLLKTTNPGTITEMFTNRGKEGQTLFKYLFFAFAASIAGYRYLRKVIVIDGTAIKGKYKGVLVAASGQDGNRQIFPLGFGVVDGETIPGWVWFFENLKRFVPDEEELVFVSDRHQSIYAGLRKVYPRAQHGACIVHLCRNVVHNFHCEALASTVSKAARAYTVGDFRQHWDEIEKRNPRCADYLLNIGLAHWTLAHFKGMRYNLMSSNISESLNAALTKAVDYPIVAMVEYIRTMLMTWFCYRRSKSGKAKTKCTRKVEAILVDNLTKSTDCKVLGASDWIYQVNDGKGAVFTVDLEKKTCSCRVFDVLLIPCCHALAARRERNVDEHTLVGECYSVSHWRKLYAGVILPIKNEKDAYIPEDVTEVAVKPPKTRRPCGRPKKVRIPSQGEIHHAKKRKTENKCGICSGTGHNRKTCRNAI